MFTFANSSLSSTTHPEIILNPKTNTQIEGKHNENTFSIKIMTDTREKTKWQKKFIRAYSYNAVFHKNAVTNEGVVFLKAHRKGRTIGFLRITDKSNFFKTRGNERVFFAADAYVLPQWRGIGVLKSLLHEAIDNYQVHAVTLEPEVALLNWEYYHELGFRTLNKRPYNGLWDLMDSFATNRK